MFPVFIQLCDGSLVQETFEFTFYSIRWISPLNKVASSAHCLIFLSLGAGILSCQCSAQASKASSQKVHNKVVLHRFNRLKLPAVSTFMRQFPLLFSCGSPLCKDSTWSICWYTEWWISSLMSMSFACAEKWHGGVLWWVTWGFLLVCNGWVQSYGSCCVKSPIIFGNVSCSKAMICLLVTVCTKYHKASHERHAYWPCDHPQLVLCEEQPVKVFEQLSLHNTIAVISYRNLSSSIMLWNDAACSMEIMWFNTFFINLSTKECQVQSMLSCGTLYVGQNWLFKQNWVSENCRSETCYQVALAMKGWGGGSWGWRSKCKISVWAVGSRHHPPVINWDGQLYSYLLIRCSNGRSIQIDEAAFWEGLPLLPARASRL